MRLIATEIVVTPRKTRIRVWVKAGFALAADEAMRLRQRHAHACRNQRLSERYDEPSLHPLVAPPGAVCLCGVLLLWGAAMSTDAGCRWCDSKGLHGHRLYDVDPKFRAQCDAELAKYPPKEWHACPLCGEVHIVVETR